MRRFLILLFCSFILCIPTKGYAAEISQDAVSFPVLLHGTTLPLQSSSAVAWEQTFPISFSDSTDAVITSQTPILPSSPHLPATTIYTNGTTLNNVFPQTFLSQSSLSVPDSPSSLYAPLYTLQPTTNIFLQGGNATSPITITSANQTNSYTVTVPQVDQDTNFVLDTLSQTLTNKVISGALNTLTNIPTSALINPVINLVGGNGISLSSSSIGLGGTLTISAPTIASAAGVTSFDNLTGSISLNADGIVSVSESNGVISVHGVEADTLDSVVGRAGSTTKQLTLSNSANTITVGTLTATGGTLNGVSIGTITPSTGIFQTVNGLAITNNGSNTLSIGSGKAVSVLNSLTLSGTDGTTLTLPGISDTLVGITSTQTLTNKTFNAASNTITNLSPSNFLSGGLSQWTNDTSFLTATGTATLTNKTIAAGSNTISGLTNTNLSGSAGISNGNLANPSITITSGSGLSGGTVVSLGGSLTLVNTGVLSVSGTAKQVGVSSATGALTLSLPQDITATDSPTFSGMTLNGNLLGSGTLSGFSSLNGLTITPNSTGFSLSGGISSKVLSIRNSLTLSGTDNTSFTLPSSSDTLVGLDTSQTLTNKTITAASNSISGLTITNFASGALSQWTNDSGFITATSTSTLTNKTIAAGSNTISGLTNTNLSGSANISNANLANSSINLSFGTGISGGTSVALGGSLSLSNTGVTSLAGTSNQVNISGTTGGVTLSLPQSIGTSSLPTFGGLTINGNIAGTGTLSGFVSFNGLTIATSSGTLSIANGKTLTTNKSLSFDGTDGTTITFQGTDTYIGRSTTDTLTNKSLAAGSNTISGLTNTNLSGSAGISNGNLANSSITITSGTGLSGGATVALGSALTLTNSGVTSLAGTTNQVNISGTTGGVTLSLPQSIGTTSLPTFGGLTINGNILGTGSLSGFVSFNGLTIATSSGTLSIANGKTLTANKSLSFDGTDGTTITFQGSDTYIGRATTDTLTNKSLAAGSNTISGLTNTNLSGTAGISNGNLANSAITITSGTGLSGGATVSLGSALTLTNSGVTSLAGTTNQVNISGTTGGVTLSLPQSIGTGSSPSFTGLTLSSASNQLIFGSNGTLSWAPSSSRTLTLPDSTDTLIGRATSDTLTNKTLTAPALNGTVTTSGLTLPAFTASGTITGSGSPLLSSFGSINGLTLTANGTGFSISGGTSSKSFTINNSLSLSGTDGTTLTFPDISDTLVGLTATQTITNKTLTAPALNGTVTTSGLTLPAFTAGGNITQSGGASITTGTGGLSITGNASISAGKTFAVTDADKLTVGGVIIPQTVSIPIPMTASLVSQNVFIADANYQVSALRCVYSVAASVAGTLQVTVDTGTTSPGGGTNQLSSNINLSTTVNTVYTGTVIGSPTTINSGDKVSVKLGGTLLGLLGTCSLTLKRV